MRERTNIITPAGNFMLTVFAAIAELEGGYIFDCQSERIAIVKVQGKYRGNPDKQINRKLWDELYVKWQDDKIMDGNFLQNIRKS